MNRKLLDRNSIFLILIIAAIAITAVVLAFALKVEPIQKAVDDNRVITLALILERNGKPAATEIMLYYPGNARAALLDIPAETGLIIKSLNRVDRIDALYDRQDPSRYLDEIGTLTGAQAESYLVLDMDGLADTVDLLDGCTLFIPNRVALVDESGQSQYLPSGSVTLDGSKMALYASYEDAERPETEAVNRRQTVFQALLRRIGERSDYALDKRVFPSMARSFRTNLNHESTERLFRELARLDMDRLVLQFLTGTYRPVEGMKLLFPHYDGELVRDIVKQTLNALINAESIAVADKVFTVEILNGTATSKLAKNTADIFTSFGYEVISVGNVQSSGPTASYERTIVLDRYGDATAASTLGAVIRCTRITTELAGFVSSSPADFVIILGSDFNGRYCVDR